MQPTARLARRIREDFDSEDAELVFSALAELQDLTGLATDERVQAAVVKLAAGDLGGIDRWLAEARIDWRDVLVAAELAGEDWAARLDDYVGRPGE